MVLSNFPNSMLSNLPPLAAGAAGGFVFWVVLDYATDPKSVTFTRIGGEWALLDNPTNGVTMSGPNGDSTYEAIKQFNSNGTIVFFAFDYSSFSLYRSIDGARTWTLSKSGLSLANAYIPMTMDAAGNFWLVDGSSGLVYKSSDLGENWTLNTTLGDLTTQDQWGDGIAAHPTDPNIIVAFAYKNPTGSNNDTLIFGVTTNGGGSWSLVTPSGTVNAGNLSQPADSIFFTSTGRLVKVFQREPSPFSSGNSLAVIYTDDPSTAGAYTVVDLNSPSQIAYINRPTDHILVVTDQGLFIGANHEDVSFNHTHELWRSLDDGASWELLVNGLTGSSDEGASIFYDAIDDRLYASVPEYEGFDADPSFYLYAMDTPHGASPAWQNISSEIAAAGLVSFSTIDPIWGMPFASLGEQAAATPTFIVNRPWPFI